MKISGPFLFIAHWPMNSYLIASVKSIMSDLFRSRPREGLCVYVSGLSQRGMRDVQRRIMAFTYPQRAAYQSCLAQVFDAAQVQMCDRVVVEKREGKELCIKNQLHFHFCIFFLNEKWQSFCFFLTMCKTFRTKYDHVALVSNILSHAY